MFLIKTVFNNSNYKIDSAQVKTCRSEIRYILFQKRVVVGENKLLLLLFNTESNPKHTD